MLVFSCFPIFCQKSWNLKWKESIQNETFYAKLEIFDIFIQSKCPPNVSKFIELYLWQLKFKAVWSNSMILDERSKREQMFHNLVSSRAPGQISKHRNINKCKLFYNYNTITNKNNSNWTMYVECTLLQHKSFIGFKMSIYCFK